MDKNEDRSAARAQHPAAPEDLEKILAARSLIDQAKGILMERYQIDGDASFEVLKRHSQHSNRKLREIAEELVVRRELPSDPTSRGSQH